MASRPHCHGPGHIFPGVGPAYAPLYLGTARASPRIEFRPYEVPYFNSIYSPVAAFDASDAGEDALVIVAPLNRWDEDVFARLQSRPNFSGTRGTRAAGELGSLYVYEGFAYPLWVQFPYTSKPAQAAAPAGYHFFQAKQLAPEAIEAIGMEPSERWLIWHCLPVLSVGINNTTVAQLYDHDMTGLPVVT